MFSVCFDKDSLRKADKYHIIALVIGGVFIVLMTWNSFAYHRIGDYGVETDFYWDYAPAADELLHLELDLDRYRFRGPGYPVILAAVSLITGNSFTAGRIISLLAAIAVLTLTWLLVKGMFGAGYGVWALLALTLNETFIEYSFRVGTDMFFTALCTTFYYILTIKQNRRTILLAGLIAGYAYLTRYNGLALVLVSLVWVGTAHAHKVNRLRRIGWLCIGLVVMMLPWSVYLYIQTGQPFFNLNSNNIAYELFGRGKMAWDQFWYTGGENSPGGLIGLIVSHPVEFFRGFSGNLFRHFHLDMEILLKWSVGWLALSGLVLYLFKHRNLRSLSWILISYLAMFSILATVFYSSRFSLPILPVYLILALVFISSDLMKENPGWWRLKYSAAVVIALITVVIGFPSTARSIAQQVSKGPAEIIRLEQEPSVSTLVPGRMAARKPHAPAILGHEFVVIPPVGTLEELVFFLDSSNVDYLFANASEALFRPPLFILLHKPDTIDALSPVYHRNGAQPYGVWCISR